MAKSSKATRKFEKRHLKDTIERRKDFAKVKQRHQQKTKKKQRAERKAPKDQGDAQNERVGSSDPDSEQMNQDSYFEGVPVPDTLENTTKVKQKLGKRKREDTVVQDVEGLKIVSDNQSSTEDEELGFHKGQLDALANKDPEFYKYLQENDAELLDFDEDGNLDVLDVSDSDDEDQLQGVKHKETKKPQGPVVITSTLITKWRTSLIDQHSIRTLRQLILAFRSAAHINDEEEQESKYSIPDSEIYHEVLMTAIAGVVKVLNHHLPVKETNAGKLRVPADSPKFKSLSPMIKSYASSLHFLLTNLSDSATIKLVLQSLEPLLPYLLQFRKLLKVITKTVSTIWSEPSVDDPTRVSAFLILRRLMVAGDSGIREDLLRTTYEGVVRGSRNTTIHTLPGINLLKNSAAELWGMDQKVSYTTGFTHIRQLAIVLRGHVTKPTKDSYKTVYNWQFIHSLDFWSRVLSTHCSSLLEAENGKESQLRPLIYPVVQITLGVMRLIPTSTYFPLRFHLVRSLLRISQATGVYIPLGSALLEVLNTAEMKKVSKTSTSRPLDFELNIRAPTSYLNTRVYQDGVGEQVVELFSEFFVLWCKSIAFPELQLPVIVMLKRWLKSASTMSGNKNAKVNQSLALMVQKSEKNARWIEEQRNKVTFAPKDRAEVEAFLRDVSWELTPFGAFVVGQRQQRIERRRALEQGRREEEHRNRSKKTTDTSHFDAEE